MSIICCLSHWEPNRLSTLGSLVFLPLPFPGATRGASSGAVSSATSATSFAAAAAFSARSFFLCLLDFSLVQS